MALTERTKPIRAWWYNVDTNFGDMVTPYLLSRLTGREVVFEPKESDNTTLIAVGSILHIGDNATCEVWGSGVIADDRPITPPANVHAVRGPMSRDYLAKQGIPAPEVYGDPAILLPLVFNPQPEKRYDWGIIPHHVDAHSPWIDRMRSKDGVKIINVMDPLEQVLTEIASCRNIASSSLHGLVAADAYGIPNTWLRLSDRVLGNGFKFHDYQLSLGTASPAVEVKPDTDLRQLAENAILRDVKPLVKALLAACPVLNTPYEHVNRMDTCYV